MVSTADGLICHGGAAIRRAAAQIPASTWRSRAATGAQNRKVFDGVHRSKSAPMPPPATVVSSRDGSETRRPIPSLAIRPGAGRGAREQPTVLDAFA